MGDAVNVAARLKYAAERGEILVGADTYQLVKSLFDFKEMEPLRAKGKAEPIHAYRLLSLKAASAKARGIAGLWSPLVGRQSELKALEEALGRLEEGEGGIVTLEGEAGVGKTRLVTEMCSSSAYSPQKVSWYEGYCRSHEISIPYSLII